MLIRVGGLEAKRMEAHMNLRVTSGPTCGGLVLTLLVFIVAPATVIQRGPVNFAQISTPYSSGDSSRPAQVEDDLRPVNVMWQDPVDLETRDLFFGPGGKEGAPDPAAKFRFLKRDTSGHSLKIEVEDSGGGRRWTVKWGGEARPETTATRIVWAAGYHVDQDYFVGSARIEGWSGAEARDVRFERDDDGFKKVDRWDWESNPFVGSRELDGLKTLMALLNNFDLKTENNKIVRPSKKSPGDPLKHIYYVNDLGATLGSTGKWYTTLPLIGETPAGTKGSPKEFAEHRFIDRVHKGVVSFHNKRARASRALTGVNVENARWIGEILARLSDKQLSDAFRAGHFTDEEVRIYVNALRDRIRELQSLATE
jgi:hypothetical protein